MFPTPMTTNCRIGWTMTATATTCGPQLVIPYTLDANDMRFATPQGFNSGDQFFSYLKDAFDTHYAEGRAGRPRMMNIGLHCRLVGRPGRVAALKRFIAYVKAHEKVWLARRIDIARHWKKTHPYEPPALRPSRMARDGVRRALRRHIRAFAWIAERAHELELGAAHDSAGGLHNALCRVFRAATRQGTARRPQCASGPGRQACRRPAADAGIGEGAGLRGARRAHRRRTRAVFQAQRRLCRRRFGFPFIIAVKGRTKEDIMAAFERRIGNDRATEFRTACREVERIALLRLKDILPS